LPEFSENEEVGHNVISAGQAILDVLPVHPIDSVDVISIKPFQNYTAPMISLLLLKLGNIDVFEKVVQGRGRDMPVKIIKNFVQMFVNYWPRLFQGLAIRARRKKREMEELIFCAHFSPSCMSSERRQ
jgi:hypothetical protein